MGPAIDAAIGAIRLRRASVLRQPFARVDVEELYAALLALHERDLNPLAPFVGAWSTEVQRAESPRGIADAANFAVLMLANDLNGALIDASRANDRAHISISDLGGFQNALSDALHLAAGQTTGVFGAAAEAILLRLVRYVWIRDADKVGYLLPLFNSANRRSMWIATLNYDNAVELAAERSGVLCDLGIVSGKPGVQFSADSRVVLAKLHGSANWSYDETDNITVRKSPKGALALIFGAGNKLRVEGPYLDLLLAFRNQLAFADHLEVCGYSFRDAHVNHIVRVWLGGNSKARVTVYDPYLNLDSIADNIDAAFEGKAKIVRNWLTERMTVENAPAETWAAQA